MCPNYFMQWMRPVKLAQGPESSCFCGIISQARDQIVPIKADRETDTHRDQRCQEYNNDSDNASFVADCACCCGDGVEQGERQDQNCGKSH